MVFAKIFVLYAVVGAILLLSFSVYMHIFCLRRINIYGVSRGFGFCLFV